MELVEGVDLTRLQRFRQRRGDAPWPLELAVYVLWQVLEGLDYVHDARDEGGRFLHLVHRDVSPGNVMLDAEGEVKLVDFGIAKAASCPGATEAGHVKGKYRYMAPEQIRGETATPASDIYASAVVLWELLSGARVYDELGVAPLMIRVANAQLPSLREARPGLPDALYRAFERATALDPAARFPSAKAFQEALEGALFEFDQGACRQALTALVRAARADASRLSLERALERARGAAGGLERAILSALEAPDRVERPPMADPPSSGHQPRPTPTRTRAVPLVDTPPRRARRGPPPPPLPSDTDEAHAPGPKPRGT
jgi:serine/threonine protein kinase